MNRPPSSRTHARRARPTIAAITLAPTTVAVATAFAAALFPAAVLASDPAAGAPALRGHGFTLYAAQRFGGEFDDEVTGESVAVRSHASYAATLDFELDEQRELQLQYGRQATALKSAGLAPRVGNLPITLQYLHVGGTYYGDGLGRGWYAIGGLGATRATPAFVGYGTETKPSAHAGFGWLQPLGRNVGVRLEARVYATLLGGDGRLFCAGGCELELSGDALVQGEVLLGVSARFR